MTRVLVVYGTRPEAIKLAPLIPALTRAGVEPIVAVTGQHREMLDQVNQLFSINPDFDLAIGRPKQTLADITSATVYAVNDLVRKVRPNAVVIQGDTSTTFAAGLASFYEKCPVVHLEAGLRSGDRLSPFPEEINRRLTTQLADLHLAPTHLNKRQLLAEHVPEGSVVVTGNTVIDALLDVAGRSIEYDDPALEAISQSRRRIILVTTHRRESWGAQMRQSMTAVRELAERFPDVSIVLPMHKNPVVRDVLEPILSGIGNIHLTEPLDYLQFARLMSESFVVLTDSGGVQEEAPSLGKPVLVMRENTERPEAVTFGTARLVGTGRQRIVSETSKLLEDPHAYAMMARAVNPYGDGKAAMRGAAAIAGMLNVGRRLPDFDPCAFHP